MRKSLISPSVVPKTTRERHSVDTGVFTYRDRVFTLVDSGTDSFSGSIVSETIIFPIIFGNEV